MKYFVIHSGRDWEPNVQPLLNNWLNYCDNKSKFIVLNGTQSNWVDDATAKIRQAEKVIYVVGETSSESPNIATEISIALREKKSIYIYKLQENYKLNKILDIYLNSNEVNEIGEVEGESIIYRGNSSVRLMQQDAMIAALRSDAAEILEDLPGLSFNDDQTLLEQYKLYVKTSEDLVKRKQNVNSFYVTLNSVLLSAIITAICAMSNMPKLGDVNISNLIAIFAAVVGLIICYSWISILNSYSTLNSSKMKVIIYMEKFLAVNLFDTEWAFVTQNLGNKKYKPFTKKEKSVAYIFGALYIVIIIANVILACVL